ncbi:MAG TPA: hypothetical protein VMY59_08330 [Candidatus Thermoplasmatota archaeon]|nr:hypothetical protein [Candidatus Thermoplasmatota archaeon]
MNKDAKIFLVLLTVSLTINVYFCVKNYWMSLYDKEDFNCVEMSFIVATCFRKIGFDAKVIYGNNNETGDKWLGHAWVSINDIYFDATSLWFNDESEYPIITFIDSYPWGYWDELSHISSGKE